MTIKNKDGSTYKLKGPNPLMKSQSFWDKDNIVLHNFNYLGNNKNLPDDNFKLPIIPEIIFSPEIIVLHQETIQENTVEEKIVVKNSIRIHCLPAINIKINYDFLYDKKEEKIITYGEKFKFEAFYKAKNDLNCILWTEKQGIKIDSIIFPQSHHARWWCIKNILYYEKGYLLICEPSFFQPKF